MQQFAKTGFSLARSALFAFLEAGLFISSVNAASNVARPVAGLVETSSSNANSISNAYFAIADFDGDLKPDVATVEVQRVGAALNARYSIRFELTAGVSQNFGLGAPAGGLQIVARDVNGDSFLDLLVSTAWRNQEVAVLLNDGRGNFTLAEPGQFATAFRETGGQWNQSATRFCDTAILVRSQSPTGEMRLGSLFDGVPRFTATTASELFHRSNPIALFSLLGRAPPRILPPATFR